MATLGSLNVLDPLLKTDNPTSDRLQPDTYLHPLHPQPTTGRLMAPHQRNRGSHGTILMHLALCWSEETVRQALTIPPRSRIPRDSLRTLTRRLVPISNALRRESTDMNPQHKIISDHRGNCNQETRHLGQDLNHRISLRHSPDVPITLRSVVRALRSLPLQILTRITDMGLHKYIRHEPLLLRLYVPTLQCTNGLMEVPLTPMLSAQDLKVMKGDIVHGICLQCLVALSALRWILQELA